MAPGNRAAFEQMDRLADLLADASHRFKTGLPGERQVHEAACRDLMERAAALTEPIPGLSRQCVEEIDGIVSLPFHYWSNYAAAFSRANPRFDFRKFNVTLEPDPIIRLIFMVGDDELVVTRNESFPSMLSAFYRERFYEFYANEPFGRILPALVDMAGRMERVDMKAVDRKTFWLVDESPFGWFAVAQDEPDVNESPMPFFFNGRLLEMRPTPWPLGGIEGLRQFFEEDLPAAARELHETVMAHSLPRRLRIMGSQRSPCIYVGDFAPWDKAMNFPCLKQSTNPDGRSLPGIESVTEQFRQPMVHGISAGLPGIALQKTAQS